MQKLLLTGGSHAEIPLIEAAKKAGWYVITTGNNMDGIGHRLADEYHSGDWSDKEFVYDLAKEKGVSAIVSGCNDFAYLSTAYACEKLGLPGHDTYATARLIHHKNEFRKLLHDVGIRAPKAIPCHSKAELEEAVNTIGFPLVVKPIDLTGGKGVCICENLRTALQAYEEACRVTRERCVLVEECIQGTNHGATMLLKGQKVVWRFIDEEQYYHNRYLVAGASAPWDIPVKTELQLVADIEKIAKKLKLVDGLFHVQFIIEADGTPVMIDPCRRAPGDLYVLLASLATGINYPDEIIVAETGEILHDVYPVFPQYIARECIMADDNGILDDILIESEVREKICFELIWGKAGDVIEDYLKYKAGILIMKFSSKEEMDDVLVRYHQLVKINVV